MKANRSRLKRDTSEINDLTRKKGINKACPSSYGKKYKENEKKGNLMQEKYFHMVYTL